MTSSLGVLDSRLLIFSKPKKWFLTFDSIAAVGFESTLSQAGSIWKDQHLLNDIQWLAEYGFITEAKTKDIDIIEVLKKKMSEGSDEYKNWIEFVKYSSDVNSGFDKVKLGQVLNEGTDSEKKEWLFNWMMWIQHSGNVGSRFWAPILSIIQDRRHIPIVSDTFIKVELENAHHNCLNVIVGEIPEPSDITPWEKLIEFKEDPDVKEHYKKLHQWAKQLANTDKSASDIEDELKFLKEQFSRSIELHKLEHTKGTLEWLITGTAELAEDVMKLKVEKLSNRLFSAKYKKIALQKAERTSQGNEVAYIVKANEVFL